MKLFLDTNIFLDLILKREQFDKALLIFNAIESRLFSGVILDITILNIDYIANKQVKDVKEFLKLVNKHFEVVGASNEMIEQALKIDNKDLEDNLQYLSAINSKCEIVITNDKSFYTKDIETVSSSEFVQRYLK
jgi:predicted nucleic acid-binding protein